MSKLNLRQEMFCKEYLVDLNATQAAIRAGYSKRTAGVQAHELLKNPKIAARVTELKAKRAESLELDAYWVLKRLMNVSDRCMQAEPVLEWDADVHSFVHKGEYKFDSLGATKATELIGKHAGVFTSKKDQEIMALKIEQMRRDVEIKQLEIDRMKNPAGSEQEDDGFMDALKGEVPGVWKDDG